VSQSSKACGFLPSAAELPYMSLNNIARLILLAAIWGASFLFIRIAVPTFGPAFLMNGRVLFAALFLLFVGLLLKKRLSLLTNWQHYLKLGFINSALPFLLFAYAAGVLTASLLSVLNATAPIWGAVIGILFYRQPLSVKVLIGLVLGVTGVAILVGFDPVLLQPGALLAVAAAASAACCYGIATHYTRRAKAVEPFANAHGSMWGALCCLLPVTLLFPIQQTITPGVAAAVLALGVICTGVAYLLYFKLVQEVGATSTLTVTFLIPVFGVLWGALFLGEQVGWHTLLGSLTVLTGTALVTGFSPRKLWQQQQSQP
jgi:drug/metabolite transporter (DMT)-like permease